MTNATPRLAVAVRRLGLPLCLQRVTTSCCPAVIHAPPRPRGPGVATPLPGEYPGVPRLAPHDRQAMYTIVCRRIHDTQVRRGGRSVWFLERDVSLLVCAALSDCRDLDSLLKLKFHGSSFLRSILMTSSPGCPQQVVRVVLVNFGKRHRHTDKRAALHRSRPLADQSGKRVASWTGKSPDTPDTHDLLSLNSMGPTPTRMRLLCNFVNVYTIAYRVQYTFARMHARIPNEHPREDPGQEVGDDVRVGVAVGPMEFKLNIQQCLSCIYTGEQSRTAGSSKTQKARLMIDGRRLIGFHNTPYVSGRRVNIRTEVLPRASLAVAKQITHDTSEYMLAAHNSAHLILSSTVTYCQKCRHASQRGAPVLGLVAPPGVYD